jgi:DNA processing protein
MTAKKQLSDDEKLNWLRLSQSENVGPVTFRQLIERYGTASKAIEALPEISQRGGLKRTLKIYSVAAAETDMERARKLNAQFVSAGERGYPPYLHHIPAAPPLICVAGNLDLAEMDAVAIVGARNASALGLKFTRSIAHALIDAGLLVVSGLARGIDTAAHEASVDVCTAAVIANGIDHHYPPENEKLQRKIGERGLLITEMLPGTAPKAEHFPRRNRIISGMSRAVIVIEAALRSGSLITARFAAEQGREVFAVPGSPLDPRAEGTNRLIKDGANMLTSASDVVEALRMALPPERGVFLESNPETYMAPASIAMPDREHVINLLSPTAIETDDIIRESGMSAEQVLAVLLELEIAGRAMRHAGGRVSAL